ncbi:hypothetical protein Patl1_37346 [Pistacia atlantica]|nr:hypothetical protein Patl1_37346 [Pistacia atlantica]
MVSKVDPSTGEAEDDGVEDEYQNAWESMVPDFERVNEYGLGPRESLTEAISVVISLLGMQPCEVLVRLQFGVDGPKDIAMKLAVRSKDENVSDMIHEIVTSG